jgi:ABC-2 type transport system ATP-binding protein
MEAIKAQGLTKTFGDISAVRNLSLSVQPGEVFGLVGPDGAGKTTTMRLLASVMDPDSGDAWVMGRHTVREAEAVKEDIAYMSQRFGLYPDLTVEENIVFYADVYGVSPREREQKMDELLTFSGLIPFKRRFAKNLSGGMKQKLGLACALIHTPKVLFLDEPTNGVDPVSRRDFWRILYQLHKQGVTIFVSTAYLDEAERCTRLCLIYEGSPLSIGTPEEIKQAAKGIILEVRSAQARKAATFLREKFAEFDVGIFGDRLHVSVQNASQAEPQIRKFLLDASIPVESIREIEPTLEDIFVSTLTHSKTQNP